MHTVIRVIVKAKTKDDALGEARCAFEDLCGEGKSFDYFTMFDEDEPTVSGKARYGSIPAALKVSTKAGAKMVREGMEITRREFNEKLAKIREGLAKYTADELFEGESKRFPKDTDLFLFRHNCYGAGQYSGPDIWLYDRFGGGIQSQRMLDSTLDEKLNDGEQFWVVPADVHF